LARRHLSENGIDPRVNQKLQRFGNRWNRLQSQWLKGRNHSSIVPEPPLVGRFYQKLAGLFWCAMDGGNCAIYEFLPLPRLRTYRQAKKWFWEVRVTLPADWLPLREQFATNKITLLTSGAILADIAVINFFTGPHVTLLPFYLIPLRDPDVDTQLSLGNVCGDDDHGDLGRAADAGQSELEFCTLRSASVGHGHALCHSANGCPAVGSYSRRNRLGWHRQRVK
jgi:hypothetical protein